MKRDWVADVLDFHHKFAPHVPAPLPQVPPGREQESYCLGFIQEEAAELAEAMAAGDLVQVADGLADLLYVTIRAGLIWGIDLRPVFAAVHETNMAKEGGHLRADNKVIKPPGWVPPDIAGILARQEPLDWGEAGS